MNSRTRDKFSSMLDEIQARKQASVKPLTASTMSNSETASIAAPFDPTTGANGQILSLPIELIEIVATFLEFRDLAHLRAAHSQITAYLESVFFQEARFHIIVDEAHLRGFRALAGSSSAVKVKHIKFANRYLTKHYIHKSSAGPNADIITKRRRLSCKLASYFEKLIVPELPVVKAYAELLPSFANLTSISTYEVMAEVTRTEFAWGIHQSHASVSHASIGRDLVWLHCSCWTMGQASCSINGVAFGAAAVLVVLAQSHKRAVFSKVTTLSLTVPDWSMSIANPFPALADFVFQCPHLENLRMHDDADAPCDLDSGRHHESFMRRLVEGNRLRGLVSIDLSGTYTGGMLYDTSSIDVSFETRLILSNAGTLRSYYNSFDTVDTSSKAQHKAFLLALLQAQRLEKLALYKFHPWTPLSRPRVLHLIAGILQFFDESHVGRRSLQESPAGDQFHEDLNEKFTLVLKDLKAELRIADDCSSIRDDIVGRGQGFDDLEKVYERNKEISGRSFATSDFWFESDEPEGRFTPHEARTIKHKPATHPVFEGDMEAYKIEMEQYLRYSDAVARWYGVRLPPGMEIDETG